MLTRVLLRAGRRGAEGFTVHTLLEPLAAAAYGLGAALFPLLSVEAFAVLRSSGLHPGTAVLLVSALALGQTVGKLVLFESARRGGGRVLARVGRRHGGCSVRVTRLVGRLSTKRVGYPLVLGSSALGLPPLAVVSLAAGASGQSRTAFTVLCLAGRLLRFAAIVGPAALALT